METYNISGLHVTLNKRGSNKYQKLSYPVRFGTYSIIETEDYIYQFNPNGDIKHLQPRNDSRWAKDEWLKRTEGNDWVYYTPGIYTGLQSYIGEYYLPCFPYKSNSIFAYNPYENDNVKKAIDSIDDLPARIEEILKNDMPDDLKRFLKLALQNNTMNLKQRAEKLHKIIGGRATVLPPDSRHVDYDAIPITLADGCLYQCGFCAVKNMQPFKTRSRQDILTQIRELKEFYGENISNYNSVFFGQHDALGAGQDLIESSADRAYEAFDFKNSYMHGTNLFMFASVDSFLNTEDSFFKSLNNTPYYSYINIGLESAEQETLKVLGKPVSVEAVKEAYLRLLEVNRSYDKIEITPNFVLSNNLPDGHYSSIIDLINAKHEKFYSKGVVYLSPLYNIKDNIRLQKKFIEIKNNIRVPAYIYLIQRL